MPASVITGSSAEGIYRSARELIREGRLRPGDTLPSVRQLAHKLDVNRNTVGAAYRRLVFDGYVHTDRRRGTIVADNRGVATATPASAPGTHNLSDGNPDPSLLPDLAAAVKQLADRKYLYGEYVELPELVETAPTFFQRPRLKPNQTAIVGGAMDGIERILSVRLKPGDRVIIEDPCFGSALDLVRALGLVAVPVQIDRCGIIPASLDAALRQNVQAIMITPVAHNPTGATMTSERLEGVIHTLNRHEDVLVIEDDHFSALCAGDLPSNHGVRGKNWVTICSVSKFFGPDMRLAAMFGNPDLVKAVKVRQRLSARWVSHILQGAVLHLMRDPKMKTNLARVGAIYSQRRALVKDRLEKLGFAPTPGVGLNLWIPTLDPQELAHALSVQGWLVRSGHDLTLEAPSGLRISTGRLDAAMAEELAQALLACRSQAERSFTA